MMILKVATQTQMMFHRTSTTQTSCLIATSNPIWPSSQSARYNLLRTQEDLPLTWVKTTKSPRLLRSKIKLLPQHLTQRVLASSPSTHPLWPHQYSSQPQQQYLSQLRNQAWPQDSTPWAPLTTNSHQAPHTCTSSELKCARTGSSTANASTVTR